jgi:hypothetical protein
MRGTGQELEPKQEQLDRVDHIIKQMLNCEWDEKEIVVHKLKSI